MVKNDKNLQGTENPSKNRNELITWINEHKSELIIVGVSVPAIIAAVLGIKNKDALKATWVSLKSAIGKRNMYSPKWFQNASDSVLHAERNRVQLASCSVDDFSTAIRLENLRSRFDKELNRRSWAGQVPRGPAYHREDGFSLYRPD